MNYIIYDTQLNDFRLVFIEESEGMDYTPKEAKECLIHDFLEYYLSFGMDDIITNHFEDEIDYDKAVKIIHNLANKDKESFLRDCGYEVVEINDRLLNLFNDFKDNAIHEDRADIYDMKEWNNEECKSLYTSELVDLEKRIFKL